MFHYVWVAGNPTHQGDLLQGTKMKAWFPEIVQIISPSFSDFKWWSFTKSLRDRNIDICRPTAMSARAKIFPAMQIFTTQMFRVLYCRCTYSFIWKMFSRGMPPYRISGAYFHLLSSNMRFFFSSFFFLSFRIYFSPYNNSKIGFMFQNYFFWNPQDVTIINQNENTVQIIIEIKKTPSIEAFTQFYSFQFFYRSCSSNLSKNLSQRLPLSCLPITENAVSWKKQPVVNGWL